MMEILGWIVACVLVIAELIILGRSIKRWRHYYKTGL